MNLKLTDEQRDAIKRDRCPGPVEDEQTHEVYFLVDQATLDTLRQDADRQAIRQGIADMEAGRVVTLEELDARIQARLRRPSSRIDTRERRKMVRSRIRSVVVLTVRHTSMDRLRQADLEAW